MATDWARPLVHWEIEAHDPERQRAFYAGLFNWVIEEGPIMNIPAGVGGPEPAPNRHLRPSHAAFPGRLGCRLSRLQARPQHEDQPFAVVLSRRGGPPEARLQVEEGSAEALVGLEERGLVDAVLEAERHGLDHGAPIMADA